MTVYVDEIGTEIRLETDVDLSSATMLKIVGLKPSGEAIAWNATLYPSDTTQLYYVTLSGDLDEVGVYPIQAYIEWGATSHQYGDLVRLIVHDRTFVDITERDVIDAVEAITSFSVQDESEYESELDTDACILYNSATRTQGNFTYFYAQAASKVNQDLESEGKLDYATNEMKIHLMALWIGALQERKDPDWNASSISISGYSVSRRDAQTGYEAAYNDYLDDVVPGVDWTPSEITTGEQVRPLDDEYYPDSFRLTNTSIGKNPSSFEDPY